MLKQTVTTRKGQNFYVNDTPGGKGTIIAVHGLTGNHKQFYHLQKALRGKYRFISYDIRGRGNSDPAIKETSIFTHAEDLLDLIKTLNVDRPILMGYSMGAYICALVAKELPQVEALILLDGGGEADQTSKELVLPSLKRLEKIYPTVQEYVDEVKDLYTNLDVNWNDTLAGIVQYDLKHINKGWTHKLDLALTEQDFETFYSFNSEEVGKQITCKTLLIIAKGKIASRAPLFQEKGYKKIRESISNIETKYTDVNHYELVFNEQPAIVQQIINFLETKGVE